MPPTTFSTITEPSVWSRVLTEEELFTIGASALPSYPQKDNETSHNFCITINNKKGFINRLLLRKEWKFYIDGEFNVGHTVKNGTFSFCRNLINIKK